jgi:dihydroxyacetone kinase-like predicted kinase
VLVVGDRKTLKVHVHTDDPEAATAVFADAGEVSRLDVADMTLQVAARADRLAEGPEALAACGALAVVSGERMADLFRRSGAVPLEGGPTLNPSTYELLAGIHGVPADTVVVLPNSSNVVMAAERAAELSDKEVRVIGARSPQAGLVAAVEFDPAAGLEANARAMDEAIGRITTGAVTVAARDDADARFAAGDAIGFVEDSLVAWGAPEATLRQVLATLGDGHELLTVIEGQSAPLEEGEVAGLAPAGIELEHKQGGQPSYWWLIAAE